MSFGFSVSDIVLCARLTYRLYDEFKQAPGACQEFARELLLFHQVLLKTKSTIECDLNRLSHSDQAALGACLDSCKELLYGQILGASKEPYDMKESDFEFQCTPSDPLVHPDVGQIRLFQGWRLKFGNRKFALRIPKLQRAISSHIEKLTALNVLLIQSYQSASHDSQEHIKERVGEFRDLMVKRSTDHALQLDSISDRLNTSQARIESQLQTILANQQRSKTPIMSQSLDASSPEGRQTWMELGRLLRDEGITPAMVQENRGLLINTMKATLKNKTLLVESIPQSYATAPEYQAGNNGTSSVSQPRNVSHLERPPASYPMNLLGSAPPRSSGFPDAFLERQNGRAGSLDQEQNIDNGMQSLLQGMDHDDLSRESKPGESEYCELGAVELEVPTRHEDRQMQGVKPLVEPLMLPLKLEDEIREVDFKDVDTVSKDLFCISMGNRVLAIN